MKKMFIISFPKGQVREPWNYQLIKKYEIIPNIVAGSISAEKAILGYEFDGEPENIDQAAEYLRSKGVTVEPVDEIRL